jgi:hypothetical protein
MVLPILLYGSECWTLIEQEMCRIDTSEMHFLRTLAGYCLIDSKKEMKIQEKINTLMLLQE